MINLIRPVLKHFIDSKLKSAVMAVLIFLCLLSSCAMKKSIQYFFAHIEQVQSLAVLKYPALHQANGIGTCSSIVQISHNGELKPYVFSRIFLPVLFLILPGFLISAYIRTSLFTVRGLPDALLRWSHKLLFLQHRLLLI